VCTASSRRSTSAPRRRATRTGNPWVERRLRDYPFQVKVVATDVPTWAIVTTHDPKANLKDYLQGGRDTLLWKLNGLSEYDVRRPLVPTGTNLLGLVKHKAHSELIYFGETFGRPSEELSARFQGAAEPNAHFWATAEEPREQIVELYQRVWAHSDATIDALALDCLGYVRHWPAGQNEVTLHEVMVMSLWTPSGTPATPTSFGNSSTEPRGY
jgi:hypothetical protein